ncbi:ATP-dependent helicase [Chloroflexota bacterium]
MTLTCNFGDKPGNNPYSAIIYGFIESTVDILSSLNAIQRECVETIEGPLLILAGPGSGKTRVITHRVAYLVKVCGIKPYRIMAVTFTNKAAREMTERLKLLLGDSAEDLIMGTFHAICARVLRQNGQKMGIDPGFIIYDDDDQVNLMKRSVLDIGLDPRRYSPRTFLSAVSAAKSQLLTPEKYGERIQSYFEKLIHQAYQRYEELLRESKALDFDDLLAKTVYLFNEQPKVLAGYHKRYMHVMVDEFQDTNIAQYALTRQLAAKHRSICVVGDPDQSIYTWRQADIRNILSFEKDYPDAKVVVLEQSYRSTKTILEAAQHVISENVQRKPKNLWTENEIGAPISLVESRDEQKEAQFVVSEVERLIREDVASLGDCAVMYRVNAQSRALEEAFLRYGLPYRLVGATRFYQRREVKDIIGYLRVIYNPSDGVSMRRIINMPPRGIGQRAIEDLWNWAKAQRMTVYEALSLVAGNGKDHSFSSRKAYVLSNFSDMLQDIILQSQELSPGEIIDLIVENTGYREYILADEDGEDRWENIMELRTVAREYGGLGTDNLATLLENIALVADTDNYDEKADAVTLITLHQSKGLEFPFVFIVGMEEKIFPHARCFDDPSEMEEERRLCYVGITRAKKGIYLIRALQRNFLGSRNWNAPSRFIKDIPSSLTDRIGFEEERQLVTPSFAPPISIQKAPSVKTGDLVCHNKFGEGVIVDISSSGEDYEATVSFKDVGIKRLLLGYAQLEKVE